MENITASSIETLKKNLKGLSSCWMASQIHQGFVLDVEKDGKHSLFNLRTGLAFEWAQNLNWGSFKLYENGICGVKKEGKYSFFDLKTNSEFSNASGIIADSVHVYDGDILATKSGDKYSISNLHTGKYFPNAENISADKVRVHSKKFVEIRKDNKYSFMNLDKGAFIIKNQRAEKIAVYEGSFFLFITGNNISYCDLNSGNSGKIANPGDGFVSNVYDKRIIEFVKDLKYSYKCVGTNDWIVKNCDFGEMIDGGLLTLKNNKVAYLSSTDIAEREMGGPIGYGFLMRSMIQK